MLVVGPCFLVNAGRGRECASMEEIGWALVGCLSRQGVMKKRPAVSCINHVLILRGACATFVVEEA